MRRSPGRMRMRHQQCLALRKENEEMRRKLEEGGLFVGPTNFVNRSFATPTDMIPIARYR